MSRLWRFPGARRSSYAVVAVVGAGALLAGGLVAGHSGSPDRSLVAAAKCALPVIEELGYDSETPMYPRADDVAELGGGSYRVQGSVVDQTTGRTHNYSCEVVPDASDKLRGLRVSRLEVE